MKKVYVVAEHQMFGHGLETLLRDAQDNIVVMGYSPQIDQAVERVKAVQADTIILYSHTPRQDGVKLWSRFLEDNPEITVISLSVHDNRVYIPHLNQQDIKSLEDLIQAIVSPGVNFQRMAGNSGSVLSQALSASSSAPSLFDLPTPEPNLLHRSWISSRPER